MSRVLLSLVSVVGLFLLVEHAWGSCNEAVCASLVSKCMLLKSCECNMMDKENCTCCKACHKCLRKLYTECCSCVGMCADDNPKDNRYRTSSVEELADPIPGLFRVLTEEPDEFLRWTSYNYPAHLDLLYFKPKGSNPDFEFSAKYDDNDKRQFEKEGTKIKYGSHHVILDPDTSVLNCTVAFMSPCMSLNKCKTSCRSMGSARYRWFHDYGCCECIGDTCLHFGKSEALCLKCPGPGGLPEEEEDDEGYYEDNGEYIGTHTDEDYEDEVEDADDDIITDDLPSNQP